MVHPKTLAAECFGTFWLVFGGCGAAIFNSGVAGGGIGQVGVSLAFGLTVLTMAYAIGPISGCHLNPAVSLGLWIARRLPGSKLIPYMLAQLVGALLAGAAIFLIARGSPGFDIAQGFASNGYGAHSPAGYTVQSAFIAEAILTAGFVLVILGVTARRAPAGFAPLAIGLALTLIHLVSIPITNTSVNPARSTGVALFAGGWAIDQLWLFWVAPLLGGAVGALLWRMLATQED